MAMSLLLGAQWLGDIGRALSPWVVFIGVLEVVLLTGVVARLVPATYQSRRCGRVLRLDESGVSTWRGGERILLSWEDVRSSGRSRPDKNETSPALDRVLSRLPRIPWPLGRESLQYFDVLALILDFYARNAGLRAELCDVASLKRRIARLREKQKRENRARLRRLTVLRVRSKPRPEVTERS